MRSYAKCFLLLLEPCVVRPGSGRFGVGFCVGFWMGLRARDFPTERVLSQTADPLNYN